ncbi:ABC transporter substrate-binding protein [Alkalilacustris brevis]|uniref:ABC transporter substrate-binding protein n=1 Tax=Alkalilacustris brevis TaxID=2026338 RepID=UPI000E0D4E98|nr:ABC transporter substrate-binding protein [Alkalilacustris brevis]
MKKTILATAATALLAGTAAQADEIKMGVLLGFTGPLESITPLMADAAELAFREASESGLFLGGTTITPVRADSTCLDSSAAVASAERLVSADGVVAIMGADCSGVTMGVLQNVAIPNGIPMISPSATSPAFTTTESNGLFYRTSPSDARQGQVLAEILADRGVSSVAVTYTNNDYGLGLADSFIASFEAAGGNVTVSAPHEDGKGDYSAEVGALAAAGGEVLAVFGYVDLGGMGIIQTSVETGAFDTFVLGDGMYGTSLIDAIGADLEGTFGSVPWAEGEASDLFEAFALEAGIDPSGSYTRESYDAAALLLLAAQAAGEATPAGIAANIMNVANAPGEPIMPGELARGLQILADGGEIDYIGASTDELIEPGEAAGSYREYEVQGGAFTTVQFR